MLSVHTVDANRSVTKSINRRDRWSRAIGGQRLVLPETPRFDLRGSAIEPRRALLRSVIGEIIERPTDDPVVARCLFTLIAPCIMLSIVSRSTLATLLPDMGGRVGGVDALIDHFERFVFAGLDAIVRDSKTRASDAQLKARPRAQRRGSGS